MTRLYPRLLAARRGRGRRTLGAVLAAAALGGCGASGSGDVNQAVGDAARAAKAVTQLSQKAGVNSLRRRRATVCGERGTDGWASSNATAMTRERSHRGNERWRWID